MAGLLLQSEQKPNITIISNDFIDTYMGEANGDFVKIYLYLLRCIQQVPDNFSISSIADRFNMTENDVRRALLYWEKKNLIQIQLNQANEIICIRLCNISHTNDTTAGSIAEAAVTRTAATTDSAILKGSTISNSNFQAFQPEALSHFADSPITTPEKPETEPIKINPPASAVVSAYQTQTSAKAQENHKNQDNKRIQEILFLAEEYLGKPLTPDETMKIYYFYDTLHFPPDLIEHLIDYCVSNGKKSMRYIEKVALSWAEKNIRSVKQAKEESVPYNKDYFTILKAFGIRERYPVDMEINYMNKWLNTYHFDINIITEACARTMKKGNQAAPFPYADTILTNWYKNAVVTKKDILALDNAHNRNQAAAETAATAQPSKKIPSVGAVHSNQFNNFEQRTDSSSYYNELENKLSQL